MRHQKNNHIRRDSQASRPACSPWLLAAHAAAAQSLQEGQSRPQVLGDMASGSIVDRLLAKFIELPRAEQLQLASLINHYLRVRTSERAAGPADEEPPSGSDTGHQSQATPDAERQSQATPGAERQSQATPEAEHQPQENTKQTPPVFKDAAKKRYYTVVRSGGTTENLLGIHHCLWGQLTRRMPDGKSLTGWPGHLHGFDTLSSALAYWHADHPTTEPVIHTY